MGLKIKNSKNIVTENLVLALDGSDKISYPGSGSTWFDRCGQGNNGTIANASFSDNSIVFDGTEDRVSTNYGSGKNPTTQDLTYEVWAKKSGAGNDEFLFFNSQWSDNRRVYVGDKDGKLAWGVQNRSWNSNNTDFTITHNQWFQTVVTFSGSSAKLYANSELKDTDTITSFEFSHDLVIGSARTYSALQDWTGNIASFRVYEKALTQTEILQNYNATKSRFGL